MERTTFFVDVIVPLAVPRKYTYRVPVELNELVETGRRALVQFGKAKLYSGIIASVHETSPRDYTAKYIEAVLDEAPVVTDVQLKLWDWMAFYYMCGPGEVMNAALPSALKLSSVSAIQLNPDFNFEEADHDAFNSREHEVIEALHLRGTMSFEDVSALIGIKSVHALINGLLRKKAVSVHEEVKEKYRPKLVSFLKLGAEFENEEKLKETLDKLEKKAFKQAEALLFFLHLSKTAEHKELKRVRKSALLARFDTSPVNSLIKKTILIEEQLEVGRLLFEAGETIKKELNAAQQQALQELQKGFETHDVALLHGVTGSGKTEVYARLISEALQQEKQVLFLLPEIALTTQLITRMRAYFGEQVGVYHSKFSENERVEIWNNVLQQKDTKEGRQYKVILGARSALFLPFSRLGLIIIDEEHDNSFKQHDPAPRYHARDTAIYLASLHKAKVVLGSATPSLESYHNAIKNKFALVELNRKFSEHAPNETIVCDTRHFELMHQKRSVITPPLYDAIAAALKNKEQIILFQNRRGFAPYTECHSCGWIPHCVQCDVSLIYHKHSNRLQCHYCGYSMPPPSVCAACGHNDLRYKGLGTEKAEEEIEILFPEAKTARMDLDTTRSKFAYKQIIDDFEERQIDILVGTQMVTKGLDFDHVSVVGILNADSSLNFPDFRSHEKAYQLITQVSGRAGRKNKKGHVYIQTSQPAHPLLQQVLKGNIREFYSAQLAEREQYFYPPFSRLIELKIVSGDVEVVNQISEEFAELLRPVFGNNMLGPEFPLVSKIRNQFYKRILLKVSRTSAPAQVRGVLNEKINVLFNLHKTGQFRIQVDVDPV